MPTSWEQAVRTHPVDKLLEQYCYKFAAGLLQFVRFYVCSSADKPWQLIVKYSSVGDILQINTHGLVNKNV
jgi:hypothetical protein